VVLQYRLTVLAAMTRHLEAAERRRGIDDVIAVYPHRACLHFAGEEMGLIDVLGPDGGSQAIVGVVRPSDDLVGGLEGQHTYHRAEDLVLGNRHVVLDAVENRGLDEEALAPVALAARQELGSLLLPEVYVAKDLIHLLLGHLRALLGGWVE